MSFNSLDRLLWQIAKLSRLRFWYLAAHFDTKLVSSLFIFSACSVSMLILGTAAYTTSWPMIFPSLGPTIFLMFYAPASPMASPRNAVLGHLMGALVGLGMHLIYLYAVREGIISGGEIGVSPWSIFASAVALGLTGMVMTWTGLLHPPAASTTLIASLGLMRDWHNIPVLMVALVLISMQAWIMHRFHGIKFPLWAPTRTERGPRIETKLGDLAKPTGKDGGVEELARRIATSRKGVTKRDSGRAGRGR